MVYLYIKMFSTAADNQFCFEFYQSGFLGDLFAEPTGQFCIKFGQCGGNFGQLVLQSYLFFV